jgi:hypothetical protein
MGKTRNKRRAKKFRKSRELQLKKKATRRQLKGGSFPADEEFKTVSTQVTTINKTMAVIIQNSHPYIYGPIDEEDRNLVERVLRDDYPAAPPAYSPRMLEDNPQSNKYTDDRLPYTPPAPVEGANARNPQAAHF